MSYTLNAIFSFLLLDAPYLYRQYLKFSSTRIVTRAVHTRQSNCSVFRNVSERNI